MGLTKSVFAQTELLRCAQTITKWPEWNTQWEFQVLDWILGSMSQKLALDVKLPSIKNTGDLQQMLAIDSIPPEGIVITRPGAYRVTKDLKWNPRQPDAEQHPAVHTAIAITCSDVTLDLQGHTVTCVAPEGVKMRCIGISVLPLDLDDKPLYNIGINNGTVSGFHTYGVLVVAVENVTLTNVTVDGLRNEDRRHGSIGTFLAACYNVVLERGGCKNSSVKSNAHSAVQLRFCDKVRVTGVAVASQFNQAGGNVGVAVVGCSDVAVDAVSVSDLTVGMELAPESPGNTCLGVFLYLSTGVSLSNTTIKDVHGSCDDSHGISVFVCPKTISVTGCTVSSVSTGFRSDRGTGAKATGVEVMVAADVHVKNCVVTDVRASIPQDRQVAGFSSGFSWRVAFEGCTARNISIVLPKYTGRDVSQQYTAAGFGWAPDPRKMFIRPSMGTRFVNCFAENADVAFDDFMHHNATFVGCTYVNCVHGLGTPGADKTRVMACDKCSECVPSVTRTVFHDHDSRGTEGVPAPAKV